VITFVVALHCEAKPLIEQYALKRRTDGNGYVIYQSHRYLLVISGVGKVAAAAAAGYCHGFLGSGSGNAWLNVGVAGHSNHPPGQGILAHRVTDVGAAKHWYPPLVIHPPCPTDLLFTVDQPNRDYELPGMIDMEAAGFYPAASRCTTSELVHCYKVISDNHQAQGKRLVPEFVTGLVEQNLHDVDRIATQLRDLCERLNFTGSVPHDYEELLSGRHYSVCQQGQLKRLLQRWDILSDGKKLEKAEFRKLKTANAVLAHIEEQIATLPVGFSG
jgi:hypothetical protein